GGSLGISSCTFTGNQCSAGGGAIEFLASANQTLTVTNCTFDSNKASFGGTIDTENGTGALIITGSTFVNNQAPNNGGALSLGTAATLTTNCTFLQNEGGLAGGAIANFNGPLTVTNCTFADNKAPGGQGGAIENLPRAGTLTVTNSSFRSNLAIGSGGAIQA